MYDVSEVQTPQADTNTSWQHHYWLLIYSDKRCSIHSLARYLANRRYYCGNYHLNIFVGWIVRFGTSSVIRTGHQLKSKPVRPANQPAKQYLNPSNYISFWSQWNSRAFSHFTKNRHEDPNPNPAHWIEYLPSTPHLA